MTELADILSRLGLAQYYDSFIGEGFDSWDTVLDITESDLNTLGVKLGHRRKLQRAIAQSRGQAVDTALPLALPKDSSHESYRSDESGAESKIVRPAESSSAREGTKRKYRRHPKPDEHAPERPPSAYVIFSNQIRESLKGQELSFTEIAKVVGERWQHLAPEEKEPFESQASAAKERYYSELAEYKKTPQYREYQRYLADFKAKHGTSQADNKRSKLETGQRVSSHSSSRTGRGHSVPRRISVAPSDFESDRRLRSDSTPPYSGAHSMHSTSSKPTSPAVQSYPGLHSPAGKGSYSPVSASSASTSRLRPGVQDGIPHSNAPAPVALSRESSSMESFQSGQPSLPLRHQYGYRDDLSRRRSARDSPSLPPLLHEDTTLSSESSGHASLPYIGAQLPAPENPKQPPHRILPAPVQRSGPATSPLDTRRSALPSLSGANQDPRHSPSLAALLRAGELARDADSRQEEQDRPP